MYFANRVKETTSTTGLTDFATTGAFDASFYTFFSKFGLNRRFVYVAENTTNKQVELGIGYLSTSTTLVRESILDDGIGGTAKVSFTTAPVLFVDTEESAVVPLGHAANNSLLPGYVFSAHLSEESVNAVLAANRVYYTPFLYLGKKSTFSGFQLRVNGAVAASSVRVSLYDSTPDFKPGTKLVTVTADFDSSTTGTKQGACTATDILPGWYFIAYSSDAAVTVQEASQMVMCPLGVNTSNTANKCYTQDGADISHPASPAPAGVSSIYGAGQIAINVA